MSSAARFWPIVPVPAPRQSNADRWRRGSNVRPCVARYHAFRDECRLRGVWQPVPGDLVVFLMPIAVSRAHEGLDGLPHEQTPDLANLVKALLDALYVSDSSVWTLTAAKTWSTTPGIYIERRATSLCLPFRVPAELVNATNISTPDWRDRCAQRVSRGSVLAAEPGEADRSEFYDR